MAGLPPDGGSRPTLLINTLKVITATALISYVTAHWLSAGGLDRSHLGRLASAAMHRSDDPAVTGSITSAGQTRLDPCAIPLRR
jgi:hypothetical protein